MPSVTAPSPDVLPVIASPDADFPSLLRKAINAEDECDESLPGAATTAQDLLDARFGPSPPTEDVAGPGPSRQSRQHKKRQRARNNEILSYGYGQSAKTTRKLLNGAQPVKTALYTANLPVSSGAHTALNRPAPQNPGEIPKIKDLAEDGFQYIACSKDGAPRPIVDRNGLIIGHIAPAPRDAAYSKDAMDLFGVIIEESDGNAFTKQELYHKRGNFPAINFGFTLPNGFKHPINLDNRRHTERICRISSCPGFARISAFQNASLAFWNPGIYEYQKSRVEQLLAYDPKLKRTTPKTIFPTAACNFRNVSCYKHCDTQNCPFGWCAITALGNFDHTQGGHLILWELKLIIEFPHACTVLIPSATITHSNIPVADGDVRVLITQYCAGSIFRYVDNGFQTDRALLEQDKKRYEEAQAAKEHRWKMSLGLLSTLQGLKAGERPSIGMFQ
ncbi:hypothetical protein B0H34DRAFT_800603 [Crassisporium funariophilum]|nr:hypothetical protein B0H34DRAFT_800603 [Crassisporium funariophilum]